MIRLAMLLIGAMLVGDVTADGLLSIGIEALGVLLIIEGLTGSLDSLGMGHRGALAGPAITGDAKEITRHGLPWFAAAACGAFATFAWKNPSPT